MINNHVYYPIPSAYGFEQTGIASWYGRNFHGKTTSNGERYNMYQMTAAHKTLPMNTVLLIKNLENNREVVVRVNDRGPFVQGRIVDVSYAAARQLEIIGDGTALVHITALGDASQNQREIKRMAKRFYNGEYYVQIGSFALQANAIRLKNRFTAAGHIAVIQKYFGPDTTYHRVQVYVGRTLKEAEEACTALEKAGYLRAFVIAR